jgi:DNA-binding Xre family transcriptional regulator
MLRFDLKEAMHAYEAKTGLHLTYDELSQMTEISSNTLKSIATRSDYNVTVKIISEISLALNINPVEFLDWTPKHGS